ncbi:hypothetical protein AVEN_141008-1 [Araneus ventricosus]|uniref:Uncharacterized protein n=1 Tax=Araneus ventricosus TaxID=182803 RepID=A0A4Y2L489_ARAVE|nr:hypothetical protein AVEN_141008-1 [Araneus ventricosus]
MFSQDHSGSVISPLWRDRRPINHLLEKRISCHFIFIPSSVMKRDGHPKICSAGFVGASQSTVSTRNMGTTSPMVEEGRSTPSFSAGTQLFLISSTGSVHVKSNICIELLDKDHQ